MAWREMISSEELEDYLRDSIFTFAYWLDVTHPNVVEEYLSEYNEEFVEYLTCELGRDVSE